MSDEWGAGRLVIGIADAKVSKNPEELLVTHALGSCLGVAAYDPVARAGGIFHPLLPSASINPERAAENPFCCIDKGFPVFLERLYAFGARKENLVVKIAGGNKTLESPAGDVFAMGKRNILALRKELWKTGILIAAEATGGSIAQTMFLRLSDGRTQVLARGEVREL